MLSGRLKYKTLSDIETYELPQCVAPHYNIFIMRIKAHHFLYNI